jgi:hypothetical protein
MQQRPAGPQAMPQRPAGPQAMQQRPAGPQAMQQRPAGPQAMQQRAAGTQAMQQRPAGPQAMHNNIKYNIYSNIYNIGIPQYLCWASNVLKILAPIVLLATASFGETNG